MAIDAAGNKQQLQIVTKVKQQYWQQLTEKWQAPEQVLSASQCQLLEQILSCSDFVANQLIRRPEWIEAMLIDGELFKPQRHLDYRQRLSHQLRDCGNDDQAKQILRRFRNREMVLIAWRDFCALAPLRESLVHLSELAQAIILESRDWLTKTMMAANGIPMDEHGVEQQLLVIGMGKLGGRELNYSSDIDLIFCFGEHGHTQGGRRSLENQAYFIRLGQRLVNLLHQVTVDGFCYRVDMRLRPFGDSGPLVVSFQAMEDYYQEQGREWERYAMVKGRVLGERNQAVVELSELMRPFVYRRYLDFSAVESLRKMKQMIAQEVRRRQLTDNIKLGQGGIREVEFAVQSLQLIRGGREPSLRTQSLYKGLQQLHQLGQISALQKQQLQDNYDLLRRVENLLQAINDQQTQTLPDNELDWARLCIGCGYDDSQALRKAINHAMEQIHQVFLDTIGDDNDDTQQPSWCQSLWQSYQEDVALAIASEVLAHSEAFVAQLSQWRTMSSKRRTGARGRETLDKLMPCIIEDCSSYKQPHLVLQRVTQVLDKILTRTTYLELLLENPGARAQLLRLCQASPWITEQLARFPLLLDELIDPVLLYNPTPLNEYSSELRQYLLRIGEDDLEGQMEALRQFKLAQQLKIAAADVTGVLPLMEVSDHLTFLAEAVIEQVVNQAWQQVTERHGTPPGLAKGETGFVVAAYGKAGGIELGYGSDLDLVFLHQSLDGQTQGSDRSIDAKHFYLKLAQRILHLFSTRTPSGILYEVDMRLRPSGASGLLVSELDSFADYQQNEAWVWEHQALIRSRVVYGAPELAGRYSRIRSAVLSKGIEPEKLKQEVRDMRKKMRDHLLNSADDIDLKQGVGGITDIEFIAQYLVLAHAPAHLSLCRWSDNVRIFEQLAETEIIPFEQAQLLINAYCTLRNASHRKTLSVPETPSEPSVNHAMANVEAIWNQLFEVS
ncbi:bifunctional [glutamate--ammonia ligase]-adenylyl-L-tyrosine phosphorylase/[glutamate--ammonia-ligase] adenylyltransferase [Paraferrimonas haliotis]|uniref:Bifunctional glutamine synthetase adenylyltransferase/adenylyl-removing enzyme n=1 Tax=Paraferrimonas haliotis TaxID=2013866 RepID=A0AA37WXZ5_9GAMM|nr:bifunctional [glutamate--ammonia ligase]-adenylyl-L-tyrosine phosphorylase/[glutamate--ammonia-ligase] adenylyltransferase [Paraferrimonas haliotis]GLS83195.1 glutamate-ammonia-ligase adenylyltransferase [Paraferrimonas haliotis]